MKKHYILIVILFSSYSIIAQKITDEPSRAFVLGNFQEYINTIAKEISIKNAKVPIAVAKDKTYLVNVYTADKNEIIGKLDGSETVFSLHTDEKGTRGYFIVSAEDNIVYRYKTTKEGTLEVFPTDINSVMCHGYHKDVNSLPKIKTSKKFKKREALDKTASTDPSELESLPGSGNIILVDMDGYQLPSGTVWNGGASYTADSVGWNEDQLKLIWAEIAEDFAPFDVNVTTKESLWSTVGTSNRQRVVINRSQPFTGGDGVAMLGSFGGTEAVCWMWMNDSYTTDEVGDVASHELGHTLNLQHQGGPSGPYYPGHDDPSHDGWVPIMGNAFKKIISQWCNSEFNGATANQDDLAIITQTINYNADDHSNDTSGASDLNVDVDGNVDINNNEGLITNRTDVDYFKFDAEPGNLNLTIKPRPLNNTGVINRSNLDIIAKLYSDDGTLMATAEAGHKDLLDGAVFNVDLTTAGTYYIEVDGYGTGNPVTGYTDYASIGPYSISGSIPTAALGIDDFETNGIRIYPNPSEGFIVIEGIDRLENYLLINGLGQIVKKGKLNGLAKERVDFYHLQKGYYILKLRSNNQYLTKPILLN